MTKLSVSASIIDGNNVIFCSSEFNIVFSLSLIDGNVKILCSIPEEDFGQKFLFTNILRWKEFYVFVPYNASSVWMTDKEFSKWRKIRLESDAKLKFVASTIFDNQLFLFKHAYSNSISINLETETINVIETLGDSFFTSFLECGEKVILPSANNGYIYEYSLKSGTTCRTSIKSFTSFSTISQIKDGYILMPRVGKIALIISNGILKQTIDVGEDFLARDCFEMDGKLYLTSGNMSGSLISDGGNLIVWKNDLQFDYTKRFSEKLIGLVDNNAIFYLFDLHMGEVNKFNLFVSNQEITSKIEPKKMFTNGKINYENSIGSLNEFIAFCNELHGDK